MSKKKFKQSVDGGYMGALDIIAMGKQRVLDRSKRYYNFFSMLPVIGNIIFYREGKLALKEKNKK